ncbi:MAG: hypothetical protein CMM76_16440 [Rhodospirillaceae bacterium]|nr:hypothetical protein [Rhodospirillaceae bacterium]
MIKRGALPLIVFRDEFRLKQKEVGKMFGVTQGAISAMERTGREIVVQEIKDEMTNAVTYRLVEEREIGVGALPVS